MFVQKCIAVAILNSHKNREKERNFYLVKVYFMMVPKFKSVVSLERMLIFFLLNVNCYLTSSKQDK
jgi:hypothetical protein